MMESPLIREAQKFGLDVEAERCDLSILRDDLNVLRHMAPLIRERAVFYMNGGWSLSALPEDWDKGLARLSDAWSR